MNEIAKRLNEQVPTKNTSAPASGQNSEVDTDRLKKLAGPADDLQRDIQAGIGKTKPESDQVARDLGPEWATSAKLSEITAGWEQELNKLAMQIGDIGPKLVTAANNHLLKEAVNRQAIQAVTIGLEFLK